MSTAKHSVRFPGESESSRAARNQLLDAEIQLRRNIEAVAKMRRDLPLGGEFAEDYVFDEAGDGSISPPEGRGEKWYPRLSY
jgi:predicted dithiol-disulfide oxidoreductase (DUF899 family)